MPASWPCPFKVKGGLCGINGTFTSLNIFESELDFAKREKVCLESQSLKMY